MKNLANKPDHSIVNNIFAKADIWWMWRKLGQNDRDMKIVAGTIGTPAEPLDSILGTQKLTGENSEAENREVALFKLPLNARLPRNMKLSLIYLPHTLEVASISMPLSLLTWSYLDSPLKSIYLMYGENIVQ